jgi:hypothetical protein
MSMLPPTEISHSIFGRTEGTLARAFFCDFNSVAGRGVKLRRARAFFATAAFSRLGRPPSMRKQLLEPASGLGWKPFHDVLEIEVRIVSVQLGGLDQAHDRRSALARAQ